MSIKIDGVSVPENCFRCFASHWYNFGGSVAGVRCGILNDGKSGSGFAKLTKNLGTGQRLSC